jgi:hypothetical protein
MNKIPTLFVGSQIYFNYNVQEENGRIGIWLKNHKMHRNTEKKKEGGIFSLVSVISV